MNAIDISGVTLFRRTQEEMNQGKNLNYAAYDLIRRVFYCAGS